MAIINKDEFIDGKGINKYLDDITAKLLAQKKVVNELLTETRNISKEGTGTEAKERIKLTQQLTTATNKLAVAEHDQLVEIQKTRIQLAEKNKLAKESARDSLKLVGAYEKESKRLNELRKQYKDLAAAEKAGSVEAKNLLKEITRLDTKLKQVDDRVGQNNRTVGKYALALKNLGSQMIGALGIGSAITLLVSGFQALIQRGSELITVTNKIKQTFDVTTSQAKRLSSQVLALAKNFDEDFNEILKASNTVSKELGISAKESLDLIQQGFQKGSNNTGEFLDILKEYPAQFKAAGIDAKTMFAIINQQVKEGIYSDKGVDAIKEGGLRLRENTKAVQDALAPLDASIKLQIKQEIAAGNSFKAIQLVSKALKDGKLTAQQTQAVIADVFGGAGEDAGLRYLQTLGDIKTNLEDVANQTTKNEDANLKLSESWNNFVNGVFGSTSVLTKAWAAIKNGLGFLIDDITFLLQKIGLAEKDIGAGAKALTKESQQTKNATDELIKSVDNYINAAGNLVNADGVVIKTKQQLNEELKAQAAETERVDAILRKFAAERKKEADANYEEYKRKKAQRAEEAGGLNIQEAGALTEDKVDPIAGLTDMIAKENKLKQDQAEEDIRREEQKAEAIKEIREALITATADFAKDITSSLIDENLNKQMDAIEAEKDLLKQKLDDGLISEIAYKQEIEKLNKKARREEAKANKRKALFDIAINTAVAVAAALPNIAKSITVGVIGALQAALVAAKPLPSYGKGEINIKGKKHTQGGINANIEGGESVITAKGTALAPKTLEMINKGMFRDEYLPKLMEPGNNAVLAGLLSENNRINQKMLTAVSNGVYQYSVNGIMYTVFADGSKVLKTNI